MKSILETAHSHPKLTAWSGAIFGWLSVDFLRSAQIFAALMAGTASLLAIIVTLPKAWGVVKGWFNR